MTSLFKKLGDKRKRNVEVRKNLIQHHSDSSSLNPIELGPMQILHRGRNNKEPTPYSHLKLELDNSLKLSMLPIEEVSNLSTKEQYVKLFPLNEEVKKLIREGVDVIFNIYTLFGFDDKKYELKKEYNRYYYLTSLFEGDFIRMFKLKLASFRAAHTNQDLPEQPFNDQIFGSKYLFGGKAYRFQNKLKRDDNDRFFEFILSINKCKGGMPKPTTMHLNKAIASTFKSLTNNPPLPTMENLRDLLPQNHKINWKVKTCLSYETMSEQIKRTVREIFSDKKFDDHERVEPFFPSTSANYNNSRSKLGTVGDLMKEHPNWFKDNLFNGNVITSSIIGKERSKNLIPMINNQPLYDLFNKLHEFTKQKAKTEDSIAIPVPLAESLKVRVITKGPQYKYFVLKPFQKFLWRTLKNLDNFQLTGTPATEEIMNEMFDYKILENNIDNHFLSVDYSDATNKISSWATETALDEIINVLSLDEDFKKLCLESLTEHLIEVPELRKGRKTGKSISGYQLNGQLMGSILSFPFLCIINASIIRWSMEIDQGKLLSLSEAKFLVNGDDGLFISTSIGRKCWEKIATFCGLCPSVGKVFFSREFFDINSTNFLVKKDYECILPCGKKPGYNSNYVKTKCINSAILYGVKRSVSANDAGKDLFSTIGKNCEQLLDECPEFVREKVYSRFLKNNEDYLLRVKSYNIPFFVPTSYGGLGLPQSRFHTISDLDLRLMRKYYSHSNYFILPQLTQKTWKIWDEVAKRKKALKLGSLPNLFASNFTSKGNSFITGETLDGQLAVETFLTTSDPGLIYDFDVPQETESLKRVSTFWKRLLKDNKYPLPEPFKISSIPPKVPKMDELYLVNNLDTSLIINNQFVDYIKAESALNPFDEFLDFQGIRGLYI